MSVLFAGGLVTTTAVLARNHVGYAVTVFGDARCIYVDGALAGMPTAILSVTYLSTFYGYFYHVDCPVLMRLIFTSLVHSNVCANGAYIYMSSA